jgi:hypothetical protein
LLNRQLISLTPNEHVSIDRKIYENTDYRFVYFKNEDNKIYLDMTPEKGGHIFLCGKPTEMIIPKYSDLDPC